MPRDLFGPAVRRERARTRKSSVVVASVIVHAGVVSALVIVSMLLPGVLPTPHASVVWDGPRMVRLADIPLPPPPPSSRPRTETPTLPTATFPVSAPDGFTPEVPRDPLPDLINNVSVVQGNNIDNLGGSIVEPPPPPKPEPTGPIRMHSGIESPRKVRDISPVYPALARAAGAQGVVIIEATIDARGDVVAAKVLRSIPMLDDAAVSAVREWKYTPARLNGEPIAVLITVTVNFTLGTR